MFGGHVEDAQAESLAELLLIGGAAVGAEENDACSGHDGGSDKLVAARLGVIAVDEDQARAQAHEGRSCSLLGAHEMRHVVRKFDSGSEEGGGQRVRRNDEYGLAAHVVVSALAEQG